MLLNCRKLVVVFAALAALLAARGAEVKSAGDLWRTARGAFNDGIYDVAERTFRALLTEHPDSPNAEEATLLLGETLVLSSKAEAAAKWMADAVTKYPAGKFADALLFWHGEALSRTAHAAEAESRYQAVIDKFPSSRYRTQAFLGVGYAQFAQQKLDAADAAFNTVLTKGGATREQLVDAQLMHGRVALARKQYGAADSQFESVQSHYADTRVGVSALYWLGVSRREQGRLDDAAAALEKVLAVGRSPALPVELVGTAWLALGEVRIAQKRWTDAALAIRTAFDKGAGDDVKRQAALRLSELAQRLGKKDEAITQLRHFVDAHPNDPLTAPVLLRVAELLADEKRNEDALAAYQRLATQFPQSEAAPHALRGAAWALLALGRNAEAAQAFAAVTQATKTPELVAEAWFKVGDLAFAANEFKKAADAYEHALAAEPKGVHVPDALWQLALSAGRTGDAQRSGAALEKLLADYPKHPRADEGWLQLAQAYAAQGKNEQAWQTFEKLWVNRDPGPLTIKARLGAAAARKSAGQFHEAITAYNELISLKPPADVAAEAAFERAHCFALSGDDAAARAAFEQMPKDYPKAPQSADAVFWLAQQQYNNKEWTEAQKLFALVAQQWPAHRLADSAILWAARAAMNRQAYKEARDILEELLQNATYANSPWRADARLLEGETLAEEGKFAEALLVFDSIPRDFPNSPRADEALGRVGNCHYSLATEDPNNPKLERYQQAILAFQQVLNSLRADRALKSQARYWIGKCYEKLGKTSDALDQYLAIVYDVDEQGRVNADPTWLCRAGFDAATLLETQTRWAEAAKVYRRLAESGVPCSDDARQRLQKIQTDHPETAAPTAR